MKIVNSLSEWQTIRAQLQGKSIGFVPTMGNLHQGHLSLFNRSIKENDISVGSIFVNPTQFNNADDFKYYPKTIEEDHRQLAELGVDYVLMPNQDEIYADEYRYKVSENVLSQVMEGKHRPGHFDGVLTVVLKLFNLVRGNHAYFGEKDYQQLQLVKSMTEELFIQTKVIGCPIARDEKGLALSSRNSRLSVQELAQAQQFATIFHQGSSCEDIIAKLKQADINVEYIEEFEGRRYAAVFINQVRLIDNYPLA